jgi:cell division septal protein FtsQ
MKRGARFGRRPAPADRNLWLEPTGRRRGEDAGTQPARRRRRLTLRAKLLLAALVLGIAAPLAAWGVRSGHLPLDRATLDEAFALETVSVEGNRRATASELVAATGLTEGMPLLAIDVDTVRALVEAHPWVERARVVRVPPSHVIVSVVEREPLAVAAADGGMPWLLDATGLPFAPAQPDDVAELPWLAASRGVSPSVASMELARGAALARVLHGTPLADGAEIHVASPPDPEGLSLLVAGIPGRVVLGHGDLADKLRRLEKLRSAGLPETPSAAVIDLRFQDRAVLRSATPPPEAAKHSTGTPAAGASPPPGRRS